MKKYAPIVLRIALSLVFIWFGTNQLLHPTDWFGFLPGWTASLPISNYAFIYLNGWFEICLGVLLLAGFYTRFVALLLALHLASITISVGFDAIGIRDFGLVFGLASVFLYGSDFFCVDRLFRNTLNDPTA